MQMQKQTAGGEKKSTEEEWTFLSLLQLQSQSLTVVATIVLLNLHKCNYRWPSSSAHCTSSREGSWLSHRPRRQSAGTGNTRSNVFTSREYFTWIWRSLTQSWKSQHKLYLHLMIGSRYQLVNTEKGEMLLLSPSGLTLFKCLNSQLKNYSGPAAGSQLCFLFFSFWAAETKTCSS